MRLDVVQTIAFTHSSMPLMPAPKNIKMLTASALSSTPPPRLPHFRNMYDLFKSIDNPAMVVNVAGKQQDNFARTILNIIFSVSGAIKSVKFVGDLAEAETLICQDL